MQEAWQVHTQIHPGLALDSEQIPHEEMQLLRAVPNGHARAAFDGDRWVGCERCQIPGFCSGAAREARGGFAGGRAFVSNRHSKARAVAARAAGRSTEGADRRPTYSIGRALMPAQVSEGRTVGCRS
jgi:hypothetical protein